jgi:hypothetical protein
VIIRIILHDDGFHVSSVSVADYVVVGRHDYTDRELCIIPH